MRSPDEQKSAYDIDHSAMLAAYAEICKSYHAIDEFRMKLLGLLPLASIIGLVLVGRDHLIGDQASAIGSELVGFVAIFAGMLTLALFGYELRGIQRTHSLITEGKHVEEILGIRHGQFHICEEEHKRSPLRGLNAKFVACVVYSMVFVAWVFIALRFSFGIETMTCVLWTIGAGVVIAIITSIVVWKLTPS